jgi:hypothetical protein
LTIAATETPLAPHGNDASRQGAGLDRLLTFAGRLVKRKDSYFKIRT